MPAIDRLHAYRTYSVMTQRQYQGAGGKCFADFGIGSGNEPSGEYRAVSLRSVAQMVGEVQGGSLLWRTGG